MMMMMMMMMIIIIISSSSSCRSNNRSSNSIRNICSIRSSSNWFFITNLNEHVQSDDSYINPNFKLRYVTSSTTKTSKSFILYASTILKTITCP